MTKMYKAQQLPVIQKTMLEITKFSDSVEYNYIRVLTNILRKKYIDIKAPLKY